MRVKCGVVVCVVMLVTGCASWAAPRSEGPEPLFAEEVVVDFAQVSGAVSVNGNVTYGVVEDPAGSGASALRVVYPAYVEGETEWPALKLGVGSLQIKDWSGRDVLLLRVFNPLDDVVDIGFYVRGKDQKHGPHASLQPSVWTTLAWSVSDFAEKLSLSDLAEVHVFMTRPARETTVLLSSLSLVTERDISLDSFSSPFMLGDFEGEGSLAGWQSNAVTAMADASVHTQGKGSVRLVFHATAVGSPRLPSFQACYYEGSLPLRDWRGFDRLAFDVLNRTTAQIALGLCLRDQVGNVAKAPLVVAAGKRLRFGIELTDLGIDLSHVVQLDLYMTQPDVESIIYVDNLRLEGSPSIPVDALLAQIDASAQEIGHLGAYADADLASRVIHTRTLLRAVRDGFSQAPTFGAVHMMRRATRAAAEQMAVFERDIHVARLCAATDARVSGAEYAVGVADSMTKVAIKDHALSGVSADVPVHVALARNEAESFQVVVIGTQTPLRRARVEPGAFRHQDSGVLLSAAAVTACVVGHVKTEKPPYPVPYSGWWPDPILDFQQECTVSPGEAVSFWVRVRTLAGTPAGTYTGQVTVQAEGMSAVEIPVILRVFDFVLPDMSALPTACSFYDSIRKMWGPDMSDEEYQRRLTECADFLAGYKIDLDHIYRQPTDDPAALALPLTQLKMLRDQGRLRAFMIFHVATPRQVVDPEDAAVQAMIDRCLRGLDYWVPRLREEGLLEYAYLYGYDEVPAANFPVIAKVFGSIKAAYPGIPLMTTAYDHSYGLETGLAGKVDWWVPLTPRFVPEKVLQARAQGMEVWWYICIGPKHPYCNWLIEYPAVEARLLMGAMTAKYRPDGFLYYALTRWPVNDSPITSGPYTDWDPRSYKTNNGDGSLFCAGPNGLLATIRAENFRDGMEDNDYVVMLRGLVDQADALPRRSRALNRALKTGRAALAVPESLVTSLQEYNRDPVALREWRGRVAASVEALSRVLK